MNKKCIGCGVILQYDKPELAGYIEVEVYEKADLCRRCFRLKCYGDYVYIKKDSEEFKKMLNDINETNDLVIYVVDILNISNNLKDIQEYLHNPMILVLNKYDLLPSSIKIDKIKERVKKQDLNLVDIIAVSSEKNYQLDSLYNLINKYKKTNNVYFVGNTNAGKSTLINKLAKSYAHKEANITTSFLPSTTLEKMAIEINDKITLIDTPGLIDEDNIVNYVDYLAIKKITSHKTIKPKTYQLENGQALLIDNFARIDYLEGGRNSFTLYMSNDLSVDRVGIKSNDKLQKLKKHTIMVDGQEDIVISGLCWIKITREADLNIYTIDKVNVYKRESLI